MNQWKTAVWQRGFQQLPIYVTLQPTALSDTIGSHSEWWLVKNQKKKVSWIYHLVIPGISEFRRWKDGTKGELPMFPLVGWTITMQMKLMVQFVPPAALHPLFPICPSAIHSSYIVCANVVNVPLSRRFGEQLTLLCCTLYFFTRHLDSLFDVFFCCQALECATSPSTIEFDSLLTVGGRIVWLLRAEVFDRWEFTFSPNLLLLAQLLVYESWSVLEWFRPLETTTKKPIVFILLIFYGG